MILKSFWFSKNSFQTKFRKSSLYNLFVGPNFLTFIFDSKKVLDKQ